MHLALKRNSFKVTLHFIFPLNIPLKLFKKKKPQKNCLRPSTLLRASWIVWNDWRDTWFNYIKDEKKKKNTKIFDNPLFPIHDRSSFWIFQNIMRKAIMKHLDIWWRNYEENYSRIDQTNSFDTSTIIWWFRKMTPTRRTNSSQSREHVRNYNAIYSRADYEFGNSADPIDWANLLAILYNTIEPYSYFKFACFKAKMTLKFPC